jgi:hypothetical protein
MSIEFLEATREAIRDPAVLTDAPNVCGLPNLEGFVEHRHDQSVLTIMAQRWGIRTFRAPSHPPELEKQDGAPGPYKRLFYQHKKRDVTKLRYAWNLISGAYDNRWLELRPRRIAKRGFRLLGWRF